MGRSKKNTIVLNLNDFDALKILKDEQLGRLFRVLCQHYRGEKYTVESDIEWPFWWLRTEIDRYNKNFQVVCEMRSAAGKKGSRSRWETLSIANLTNITNVTKEADSDNGIEYELKNEILEIKTFFLFNKRICPVQSEFERFWSHYEKNGWVDGNGVPITNKLACAKNWNPEASVGRLDISYTKAWERIYNLLKDKEKSELMITDIYGLKLINGTLVISCTKQLYDFVESNLTEDVCAAILKGFSCDRVEYLTNV